MDEIKLRVLMEVEADHEINPEEDFFEIGLLSMHGLIDDKLNLTSAGYLVYLEMINPSYSQHEELILNKSFYFNFSLLGKKVNPLLRYI